MRLAIPELCPLSRLDQALLGLQRRHGLTVSVWVPDSRGEREGGLPPSAVSGWVPDSRGEREAGLPPSAVSGWVPDSRGEHEGGLPPSAVSGEPGQVVVEGSFDDWSRWLVQHDLGLLWAGRPLPEAGDRPAELSPLPSRTATPHWFSVPAWLQALLRLRSQRRRVTLLALLAESLKGQAVVPWRPAASRFHVGHFTRLEPSGIVLECPRPVRWPSDLQLRELDLPPARAELHIRWGGDRVLVQASAPLRPEWWDEWVRRLAHPAPIDVLLEETGWAPGRSFLDSGGDSLKALQLAAALERKAGVTAPLGAFFVPGSLRQLAGRFGQERHVLQEGRSGQPTVVFLPPRGGSSAVYRRLVRFLPARVIGFEGVAVASVEEAAEIYLRQLEGEPGPLLFCGLSMGGWTAYEMARRRPACTALLIDARVPGTGGGRGGLGHVQAQTARLLFHLRALARGHLPPRRASGGPFRAHPLLTYTPRSSSASVVLFRAQHQPFGTVPRPCLGWSPWAPRLRLLSMPGMHGTMLVEHPYCLSRLGPALTREVERVRV